MVFLLLISELNTCIYRSKAATCLVSCTLHLSLMIKLVTLCSSRFENRTISKTISIRQSGFAEDAWIWLGPLSTTNFSWEDPYGQKFIDAKVDDGYKIGVWNLDLERSGSCFGENKELGLHFQIVENGDVKVARFTDVESSLSNEEIRCLPPAENLEHSHMQSKMQNDSSPVELIIELGVVGISILDHRPKEVSYFYFERVFLSFSTGYDGGTTSRLVHTFLSSNCILSISFSLFYYSCTDLNFQPFTLLFVKKKIKN